MAQDSIDTIVGEIASAPDDYTETSDLDAATSTERAVLWNGDIDDNLSLVTFSNGNKIDIFRLTGNQFYSGKVTAVYDGKHQASYEDGDVDVLGMSWETWRSGSISSECGITSVSCAIKLKSSMQDDLQHMFEHLGSIFFSFIVQKDIHFTYCSKHMQKKKRASKKTVCILPRSDLSNMANIISSRVLYRVNVNENKLFKLKACIPCHENENSLKHELVSRCLTCAPKTF